MKARTWLVLTFVDPFPVMIGHVAWSPDSPGPFYSAGSKTYHPDDPKTRVWAEGCAAYWTARGYRVELSEECR